jgi:ribonuclease HI
VFTSLLGLVIVSHLSPRGLGTLQAGAAAIITSLTGVKYRDVACLSFALESDRCTNNIAKYKAVILGLHKLQVLDVTT